MSHDPRDVEIGRAAIERGLVDKATALRVLERATTEQCGFVEAARRESVDPRALAALAPPSVIRPSVPSSSPPSQGLSRSSERDPLPPLGTTIGGYRLERLLGKGGMGGVFIGVNEAGTRRAIKVPIFTGEGADEWRARFEREASSVAKLKPHPNVIRVHGAGVDQLWAFCVLELIEGESIDDMVKRGPLEIERALQLGEQLARALAHIHEAGILHRDVKPGNVMVRGDGMAVLMDFGLARDMAERDRLTQSGVLLGTPAYAAPEQLEGRKDVDARADIYAAGAVLYEMVTGSRPFEGDSQMELMKHVLIDELPPLASKRKDAPPQLETIVQRAMAKARMSRYRTAAALADDLARLRRGEAILARKLTAREKLAARWHRFPRRAKWVIASLVAVSVLIGGGIVGTRVVGMWLANHGEALRQRINGRLAALAPAIKKVEEADRAALAALVANDAPVDAGDLERSVAELAPLVDDWARSTGSDQLGQAIARADQLLAESHAVLVVAKRPDEELAADRVPAGSGGRFLQAVVRLRGRRWREALDAFTALTAEAQRDRPELIPLAALAAARAASEQGPPESALAKLDAPELAQPAGLIAPPKHALAERVFLALFEKDVHAQGKDLGSHLPRCRRIDDAAALDAIRATVSAILARESSKPSAATRDLVYRTHVLEPRACAVPSNAPIFVEWMNAAIEKDHDPIAMVKSLEMMRIADANAVPPYKLIARLKSANIEYRDNDDAPHWIDLLIGGLRVGLNPEIAEDTRVFIDKHNVVETLRARVRAGGDWATKLALAFVLMGFWERYEKLEEAESVLADVVKELKDMSPTPAALSTARMARGETLGLLGRRADRKDKTRRKKFDDARAELDAAIADYPAKPDIAYALRAGIKLDLEDVEGARLDVLEAIKLADDRVRKSGLGADSEKALAEGRPPGRPLDPTDPRREDPSMVARRALVQILVILNRDDEMMKVAEDYEKSGERIAYHWRLIKALALFARGKEGDFAAAGKLIDDDVAMNVMTRTDDATSLRQFAAVLASLGRKAQAAAARRKGDQLAGN